jgi:hypothetical protein
MSPVDFKDMIMKTFYVSLSGKELGAMARYYEVQGKYEYGCIDIYIYVCMGKYMFLYMYIYAYMYTCMKESRAMARYYEVQGRFICIYIWTRTSVGK